MKVYTVTGFHGVNPVGTSAIVVADTIEHARSMLNYALTDRGLAPLKPGHPIEEHNMHVAHATILNDGDY
jgi:hypothetical protein